MRRFLLILVVLLIPEPLWGQGYEFETVFSPNSYVNVTVQTSRMTDEEHLSVGIGAQSSAPDEFASFLVSCSNEDLRLRFAPKIASMPMGRHSHRLRFDQKEPEEWVFRWYQPDDAYVVQPEPLLDRFRSAGTLLLEIQDRQGIDFYRFELEGVAEALSYLECFE